MMRKPWYHDTCETCHARTIAPCGGIGIMSPYFLEVKGCFWHSHSCTNGRKPSTNVDYWTPKLLRNRKRDSTNERKLLRLGWSVYCLWECKLGKLTESELRELLRRMLPKK
jgi:G:T-mismatch repair DNA endonuclease (very short patch repair protein)